MRISGRPIIFKRLVVFLSGHTGHGGHRHLPGPGGYPKKIVGDGHFIDVSVCHDRMPGWPMGVDFEGKLSFWKSRRMDCRNHLSSFKKLPPSRPDPRRNGG